MRRKFNRFMELFWLAMTLVALAMALYMLAASGWAKGIIYMIFPLLAGAMYGLRRMVRSREKYDDR